MRSQSVGEKKQLFGLTHVWWGFLVSYKQEVAMSQTFRDKMGSKRKKEGKAPPKMLSRPLILFASL